MDTTGSGKISIRYFAIRAKNKNLVGRSGIGLFQTKIGRFSQIGAVEKHAPVIFNGYYTPCAMNHSSSDCNHRCRDLWLQLLCGVTCHLSFCKFDVKNFSD